PSNNSAIRVAIDLGVFEKLMQDEGSPKSSSQLGTAVGADPQLLGTFQSAHQITNTRPCEIQALKCTLHVSGRILRHLAAMGIIHETDADEYTSTTLSEALATKTHFSDGIPFVFVQDLLLHVAYSRTHANGSD
ncbi:MAG: hypothetical protein M1830_002023, partial [Pleopsidium flavum]